MEVLLAALILILDQGTKLWAHSVLRAKPLVLIPGALELTYLENRGAVWGPPPSFSLASCSGFIFERGGTCPC